MSKETKHFLNDEMLIWPHWLQISAAAMARVARYTGAEGAPSQSEVRILSLLTQPGRDHSLYAILATVLHQDPETHLAIL